MEPPKALSKSFSTYDLPSVDEQENNHEKDDAFLKELVKSSTEFNLQFFSFYYELLKKEALAHQNEHLSQANATKSLDLFYIFFEGLLPLCRTDNTFRVILIRKLNGLIFNTTYIKGYCSERLWILKSLDYLHKYCTNTDSFSVHAEIINTIQVLALFNIRPLELQALFKAIRCDWSQQFWGLFMELLQRMVLPRDGPDVFFDFTGKSSGILVPMEGRKWPANGYSIFAYIRIESFDDPTGGSNYKPRLYSFFSDDGNGLQAFFIEDQLAVESISKKKSQVQSFKFRFEPRKWYFLLLSHEYHLLRSSEITLYINGVPEETLPLLYPKVEKELTCCMIGNNDEIYESGLFSPTKKNHVVRTQPILGQMGVFCILQNKMEEEEVKKIYELGPNLYCTSNTENTEIISGQKSNTFIIERKIVSKIFFYYTPKAVEGMLCIDVSYAQNKNTANYYATKMEGVKEWNTKSFNDCIHSIGGIKVLLTLLRLKGGEVATHQDPSSLFVLLLKTALYSSSTFEEQMIQINGFHVLGYLLESIPPSAFSADTIIKLDQLTSFIIKIYGPGPLLSTLLRHVLLNFRIWIFTNSVVQLKLIQAVATYASQMPNFFRAEIRVDSFVDIIRYFYWVHPLKRKALIIDKNMVDRRPPNDKIKEMRLSLLRIIGMITDNNMFMEEIQCIVYYLRENSQDLDQTNDFLELFSVPLLQFFNKKIEPPNAVVPPKYYADLWDTCMFAEKHYLTGNFSSANIPSIPKLIAYTNLSIANRWKKIYRSLDRDPEGNGYWKLDLTENTKRMRRRLSRFHHHQREHFGCAKSNNTDSVEDSQANNIIPEAKNIFYESQKHATKKEIRICQGITLSFLQYKPEEVFREGFLKKMSQNKKNWKVRYFSLGRSQMEYRLEGTKRGLIPLDTCHVHIWESKYNNDYTFELVTPSRTYVLSTTTRLEMEEWVRDIRYAIPVTSYSSSSVVTQDVKLSTSPILSFHSLPPSSSSTTPIKSNSPSQANLPSTFEDESDEITFSIIPVSSLVFKTSAQLIMGLDVIHGVFEIADDFVYFHAKRKKGQRYHSYKALWKWHLDHVKEIYRRTFILRPTALEIFLVDKTAVFLNFPADEVIKVINKLTTLRPQSIVNYANMTPDKLVSKLKITKLWKERQISNFQYLEMLNTISGRTFNDLNQYPVFPWILTDYTSSSIDLNNTAIYRDLSKPIGALNDARLQQFIERYESFDDPNIPKFHYGTHYSNAGGVLFYLMRLELFTSYFAQLGDGKFDHPERMFVSLERTWQGCLTNNNNVKELTPEFFYLPEFLVNLNNIDFGSTKMDGRISNVVLPPWADSPETFIRINRAALESEYVSAHLNEWIDLIFGFKQRGVEAVKAFNTFFYLTYPGVVDLDAIADPLERRSIEAQVLNFGQCPNQLFFKPHPKRLTLEEAQRRERISVINALSAAFNTVTSTLNSLSASSNPPVKELENDYTDDSSVASNNTNQDIINNDIDSEPLEPAAPEFVNPHISEVNSSNSNTSSVRAARFQILKDKSIPLIAILCYQANVLLIYRNGLVAMNSFVPTEKEVPFTFILDRSIQGSRSKQIDWLISSTQIINPSNCFVLAGEGNQLISCGNWDNSFKITVIPRNDNRLPSRNFFHEHKDVVSCVARDENLLVTASIDGVIKLWELVPFADNTKPMNVKLKQRLYGHMDEITCIDINNDEDLIASGSYDKTVKLFTVGTGEYVRSIQFRDTPEIVKVSPQGSIVTLCGNILYIHTVNGKLLAKTITRRKVYDFKINKNGKFIVTGGDGGHVLILESSSLKTTKSFELPAHVRSVSISVDGQFIFAGLETGDLWIVPFD